MVESRYQEWFAEDGIWPVGPATIALTLAVSLLAGIALPTVLGVPAQPQRRQIVRAAVPYAARVDTRWEPVSPRPIPKSVAPSAADPAGSPRLEDEERRENARGKRHGRHKGWHGKAKNKRMERHHGHHDEDEWGGDDD